LVLNFFLTYFGHQPTYRDLADDDVMTKLICQGSKHNLWANIAKDALDKLDENKTPDKIKKYFDLTWDENKSLPLATSNGPFGIMTIV
jgi:hypothetical protein